MADALWYVGDGQAEIRPTGTGETGALVETLWSGLSRGTERLVSTGGVPAAEHARMRAPNQEGDFPFPVKYGYANVGIVREGSDHLVGQTVFSLFPHQTLFRLPEDRLIPVPKGIPPRRATLAANMETALNALWDADPAPETRVAVIGAGVVGCLTAFLLRTVHGVSPDLIDKIPRRAATANELDVRFVSVDETKGPYDLVLHTSASAAGLTTGLNALAFEGTLIEMSWYGADLVPVPLGGAFHSQRLRIVSSQVGHVAPAHRATVSYRDRLAQALTHLADPSLDALITREVAFRDIPRDLGRVLGNPDDIAVAIQYPPQSPATGDDA